MEQVLAPRFEFKPKNVGATPGYDYGEGGYTDKRNNVGFNEISGQIQIEIKGLVEPQSPEAQRICREDLNEVITAFVQDRPTIERGLFGEDVTPEELTVQRMGKIVRDKYPELSEEDQEAVRQRAVVPSSLPKRQSRLSTMMARERGIQPSSTAFGVLQWTCVFWKSISSTA